VPTGNRICGRMRTSEANPIAFIDTSGPTNESHDVSKEV
jgi:hypothetical protein